MEAPVIVCGLGHVGWRVIDYLKAGRIPVVAIDNATNPDDSRLGDVRLVVGDCRDKDTLEEAGLGDARAVLILTSDDLVNISTTLAVRHAHPTVRIVVRMFNQNLIARLGKAIPNTLGLSTSALAAPLLALTALTGDALGTFTIGAERFQVAELTVQEQSPLRGRSVAEVRERFQGQVLAHFPQHGRRENWEAWGGVDPSQSGGRRFPTLAPGQGNGPTHGGDRYLLEVRSDTRLSAGDHLVVCGDPKDVEVLLAQQREPNVKKGRWLRQVRRGWRYVKMAWRTLADIDKAVLITTAVFLAIVIAGTLVYWLGGAVDGDQSEPRPMTLSKAVVRTVSLMATAGNLHENDWKDVEWAHYFISTLRLVGAVMMGVFTAIVTNYLIRARLSGVLEVSRVPEGGHIVICGLGKVGFRVAEELRRDGQEVVIIEQSRDNRFLTAARRLKALPLIGDCTVTEVLQQAHAATARAVIACTSNELVNLEVALLARELNPKQRVVLRLADPQLARTLREAAGVRLALSIPAMAAPAFLAALYGDVVRSLFLVGSKLLTVLELTVPEGDPFLCGQPVRTVAHDFGLLPVHLADKEGAERGPVLDQILAAGDRVTVIASLQDLERLMRRVRAPANLAVDVTAFPAPARPWLAEMLTTFRNLSDEAAQQALDQLPVCLETRLTKGQAEELLARLQGQQVEAVIRSMSEGGAGVYL